MVRKIVKYGQPVLEQTAAPVTAFNDELKTLVRDMFDSMYEYKGVGLAAPQVGVSQRVFIVDTSGGEDKTKQLVLVNPEILSKEGKQVGEEGCLSIPGFREDVARAAKVRVRFQDVEGATHEMDGEELLARAIQHENDHLNGVLFLSHLSPLKRELIRRRIKKLQKAGEWD